MNPYEDAMTYLLKQENLWHKQLESCLDRSDRALYCQEILTVIRTTYNKLKRLEHLDFSKEEDVDRIKQGAWINK